MNAQTAPNLTPLCVDLDGTLIRSDLLFESLARLIKTQPWMLLAVPFWLLAGKAVLKRNLARRVSVDVESLPYNAGFVSTAETVRRVNSACRST